jgi:hypothetical protein
MIHRFGIPEIFTTNQVLVFVGQKITKYAGEVGFKL